MKDIKIFVSHTSDSDNKLVTDKTFQHIIGGAYYNTKPTTLLCGNTGNHISEKNKSYCELTAQYWAWKNAEADYYGFCHYRRYFSFGDKVLKEGDWGVIEYPYLSEDAINELKLNEQSIHAKVEQYDFLIAKGIKTNKIGNAKNVYEHYKAAKSLDIKDVDIMLQIIDEKYSFISSAAHDYMKGNIFYPCNMFIMNKELFNEYSTWLFAVLEEFERRCDMRYYSRERYRTTAHLAERLVGIYYEYVKKTGKYRLGELQVALFKNVEKKIELKPEEGKHTVPIVLSSSDAYAPILGVCIQSIVEHISADAFYELVILQTDITSVNKNKIKKLCEGHKNVKITFANVGEYLEHYKLKTKAHFTVQTYYRFMILDIMKAYDKVLYLDCDMIIKADMKDFYDVELGDNLIGAVTDADFLGQYNMNFEGMREYCDTVLKLKCPYNYFQAGALLLNVKELNKITTVKELLDMAQTNRYKYADQDILNVLCEGRVKYLDMRWNVLTDCNHFRWDKVIKNAPYYILDAYEQARKNPYIIHYAGGVKPWDEPNEDMGYEFWKTARNTEFYEIIFHSACYKMAWTLSYGGRHAVRQRVKNFIWDVGIVIAPVGSQRRAFLKKLKR